MEHIKRLVDTFPPITLAEMANIRLMRRTDTKFVAPIGVLPELLKALAPNYYVQRVEGEAICTYRTTYFDTPQLDCFQAHQKGRAARLKVRVRTYAQGGDSYLEIKRKDNHGKTHKRRTPVSSLRSVIDHHEGADFLEAYTGCDFSDFQPALHNEFERITLVNRQKTERLTLDFNLRFRKDNAPTLTPMPLTLIIELKREGRAPSPLLPVLRQLRIHPGGFSKYCIATVMADESVRINRFKKKLIRASKACGMR